MIITLRLSKCFLEKQQIDRKVIIEEILDAQDVDILDRNLAAKVVDKLDDYGILNHFSVVSQYPLAPPSIYYQITYQSIMDYLIAREAVEEIIGKGIKQMPDGLRTMYGAQQMAAIILLSEYQRLVGDEKLWRDDLNEYEMMQLRLFVLGKVKPDATKKFRPWLKTLLKKSMPTCRTVLSNIIVPVARIENHPLGPIFLHQVLMSFKSAAQRDIIWSGPDYLPDNHGAVWEGHGVNPLNNNKDYQLNEHDRHNGLPLIFAWSLTTVDNDFRANCRKELTKWGGLNPVEFLKLLDLAYRTNDPQMQEDLICCAYGIASLMESEKKNALKELAAWMLKEIFEDEKIIKINNVIIRYAARAVVERAYIFGAVNKRELKKARPSYQCSEKFIEMNTEDPDYFGIVSIDLKVYIIEDSYNGFFNEYTPQEKEFGEENEWEKLPGKVIDNALKGKCGILDADVKRRLEKIKENRLSTILQMKELAEEMKVVFKREYKEEENEEINELPVEHQEQKEQEPHRQYHKKAAKFLKDHAKQVGKDHLTPKKFVLAALKAFLKKMGRSKEVFLGNPRGGKPGEKCGADIAIQRQYNPTTHGERSKVMSFVEKYTWCFIHEVKGYFADRLPYFNLFDKPKKVDDYGLIEDIPNPAQDLALEKRTDENPNVWFLPGELSPDVKGLNTISEETVKAWIEKAPIPDFSKWLSASKNEMNVIEGGSQN